MLLDFEKPIAELEDKLARMLDIAKESKIDVSKEEKQLKKKIHLLKKEVFTKLTRWQRVQLSRHAERPYTLDYIHHMTDEFLELHGDRYYGDDKAMVGGLGTIDGKTYMFIGQQKGRNTKDRQKRNFGMANPEGYRKALRLMKTAEKFSIPVICLIDTPGAYPGLDAEKNGQAEAIAKNIRDMFAIEVPIVCIIIGEGASGGAIGIGVGDRVIMLENTWYSVISPESCSSILWRNWDYKEQAAEALKLTPEDMLSFGLIDRIIEEPLGGAHTDFDTTANALKKVIIEEIKKLSTQNIKKLTKNRIDKFLKMGNTIKSK